MDHDDLDFPKLFNEKLKTRGLSLKKLSEISGIAPQHLQSISDGDFAALPSAPYVHGYLTIIGEILDFDPEFWWNELRERKLVKSSGAYDQLPRNRFAPRSTSILLWIGVIVIVIASYVGIRFSAIFGKPMIELATPTESIMTVAASSTMIAGRLTGGDELLINHESIPLGANGGWQKIVFLEPGLNVIEITARKFLGRETTIVRQVVYEPPVMIEGETSAEEFSEDTPQIDPGTGLF